VTPTLPAVRLFVCAVFFLTVVGSFTARAQSPDPQGGAPPASAPTGAATSQSGSTDDATLNLPTTLRLPNHKGTFHLTHRFAGNLTEGTFSDQASSLFGLDEGATIGLEYRYAVARHLQAVVHRSSFEKTIQFSGKYDALHQSRSMPFSVSALVAIEGQNNFQERFAPSLGLVASRGIADRVAVYASPIWVHNSAAAIDVDRDTLLIGLGGRIRVASTVYLVGEASPRAAGYAPGQVEYGFGLEKRVGAHVFQLTFTNTFGTTFGQLVRGGASDALYLGFNLTRKFF
jgi:hypothetical protein